MLARLEHVVRNDSMPPAQYLSMHWTDSLSADEKQAMLAWIAEERATSSWSLDAAAFKAEPIQPLPLMVQLDQAKVALGNKLFHDRLLSGYNTLNCASCHDLTRGGTDQAKVATGIRPTRTNQVADCLQYDVQHCSVLGWACQGLAGISGRPGWESTRDGCAMG